MAATVTKKYSINAKGILDVNGDVVSIENEDSGEMILLSDLFSDFADKKCTLSIAYNEDYE